MLRVFSPFIAAVTASLFFILPAPAVELTFQNGLNGYEGGVSTTLHGGPKRMILNYGNADILGVAGVKHGGFMQLGLLKFDDIVGSGPEQIPSGATIVSARLELYKLDEPRDNGQYEQASKYHRELRAFKMLTEWKAGSGNGTEEEGASCFSYRFFSNGDPSYWGTANVLEEGPVRGLDFQFNPRAASPLRPGSGPMWMSWDVTEYVAEWVSNPESNHGVFLNALGYYVGAFFSSCQHPESALRPRLIVEYN